MTANACPEREELSAYLVGQLSALERDSIERHIDHCEQCQDALASCSDVDDALVATLREPEANDTLNGDRAYCVAVSLIERWGAGSEAARSDASAAPPVSRIRDYVLIEKIGEGGMGAVYKGRHERLKRDVAIKLLSARGRNSAQSAARFEREIEAIGAFDHPHIVRAYDAGEADGLLFLAMEYVAGLDLGRVVHCLGVLPIAEACEICRQAALALAHAHEQGLVHRDVKPSNLMLAESGQVKLLDLGLARLRAAENDDVHELTASGQMMGTLDYMAPEQLDDSRGVDIRADIYSLGATLYKLLCGQAAAGDEHEGRMSRLQAIADGKITPIRQRRPQTPAALAAVMDRLLARAPEKRFSTPGEVASALAPFCQGADLVSLLNRAKAQEKSALAGVSLEASTGAEQMRSSADTVKSPKPAAGLAPVRKLPIEWMAIAAGLLAVAVVLGVVYTFRTPRGVIEVEVTEEAVDDIQVALLEDGEEVEIADANAGWQLRAKEGVYQVELRQSGDRFQLDPKTVTVTRDNVARVKVRLSPAPSSETAPRVAKAPAARPADSPAPLAPQEKPFIRITADGARQSFQDSGEIFGALQDGDVIEVHGNGPFPLAAMKLDGKSFTLRAAPGYRPRFVQSESAVPAWLQISQGRVLIEGCDFQSTGNVLAGGGANWELRDCRFLTSGGFIESYRQGKLRIASSMIMVSEFSLYFINLGDNADLDLNNNVIVGRGTTNTHVVWLGAGRHDVRLTNNTIRHEGWLFLNAEPNEQELVKTSLAGNLFQLGGLVDFRPRGENASKRFDWQALRNLYVGLYAPLGVFDGAPGEPIYARNLAEANQFWGREEERSRETPTVRFEFESKREARPVDGSAADPPEFDPRAWRVVVDSSAGGALPRGERFGADVDRVAPTAETRATLAEATPDREKPFVLLRDGEGPREFVHFSEVLAVMQDGDAIEVYGNGPFRLSTIALDKKSLAIRAARGYRPKFVPTEAAMAAGHWITVNNAKVDIEGCDFQHLPTNPLRRLLVGGGRSWTIRNCRFLGDFYSVSYQGPSLQVFDSLIDGSIVVEADSSLEVENCLLWCRRAGIDVGPGGGQSIRIRHSTFVGDANGIFGEFRPDVMPKPVAIDVQESVFQVVGVIVNHEHHPLDLRNGPLRWSGRRNLYVGSPLLPVLTLTDQDGTQITSDLESWQKHWNSDADSQAMQDVRFGWDQARLADSRRGVEQMAALLAQLRREHGIDELGPNWDLVGPGEAYVRALSAEGRPVAPNQLRLPAPEEGPFVVLRDGLPPLGNLSLQGALDAAESGDTIEIRGDGPFPAGARTERAGLSLTIRAAPGYLPVFDGDLVIAGESTFVIEGIEFRRGSLNNAAFSGRVARLMNCSFNGGRPGSGVWVDFNAGPDRPAEIVNCWLQQPFWFGPSAGAPERRLVVRNSLLATIGCGGVEQGRAFLELHHCAVWHGALGDPSTAAHRGYFMHRQPQVKLSVTVRSTLFDAGDGLVDAMEGIDWSGSQNVYRSRFGVREVRAEEGSAGGEPLIYDPRQWRLLDDSSGAIGADVDRVGA